MGEEVEERLLTADELNAACEVVEFGIRAKYQYAELRIDLAAKLLREVARLEAANESLRASLTRAEAEREAMAKVLGMAARTFRKYEQLHRDKGTAEGTSKANSNMIIAQLCEHAIPDGLSRASDAEDRGQ